MNLTPEFNRLFKKLLTACKEEGIIMKPYSIYRTLDEQNKLWRQSRSGRTINKKIEFLRDNGAFTLAESLERVGPSNGAHSTNAYGGLSWHNWKEAVDCYRQINGKAVWETEHYKRYGELATELGLTSLGVEYGWDWVHVQLRPESSPLKLYSLKEINDYLEEVS